MKKRSKETKNILKDARMAKQELDNIKFLLKTGQISYDKARDRALKPLERLNAGMVEIAKEHGVKHKPAKLPSFLR